MKQATKQMIELSLGQDETIQPEIKAAIIGILEGKTEVVPAAQAPLDRVLSRLQVAALFGCRPENVDYYGRMGYIRRVSITGKQAQGYSEQSVREALQRKSTLRTIPRDPRAAREAKQRKRDAANHAV